MLAQGTWGGSLLFQAEKFGIIEISMSVSLIGMILLGL